MKQCGVLVPSAWVELAIMEIEFFRQAGKGTYDAASRKVFSKTLVGELECLFIVADAALPEVEGGEQPSNACFSPFFEHVQHAG